MGDEKSTFPKGEGKGESPGIRKDAGVLLD